jgi:hypothetical protein
MVIHAVTIFLIDFLLRGSDFRNVNSLMFCHKNMHITVLVMGHFRNFSTQILFLPSPESRNFFYIGEIYWGFIKEIPQEGAN